MYNKFNKILLILKHVFKVKYKLHLTGLQISNSKDDGTDYYTSHDGQFKIKDGDNNIQFRIKNKCD